MAGHSKFKNIMHRKGAQDKKRARQFAKLSREITVAAKMGSPDPDMNPRLRLAISAAKSQSMPKDNIERAVSKSQAVDSENYEEMRYEGFGSGGIAIIVEVLTDNKNRSAADIRSIFTKSGGNLGESGSVNYMFDRLGLIVFAADIADADAVFEAALEAGAEDVSSDDEVHEIYCDGANLHAVTQELEKTLGETQSAKLMWRAKDPLDLDKGGAEKILKLLDTLEDHDDVQEVFGSFNVPDEVMEQLE
jgi:YebC/PmpR family DNA-binding regulatory protein